MIPRLVNYQRAIAAETGCAFFDTYTAMGGEGTVAHWCEARPKLMGGDFTDPTAKGAEIVGTLIHDAIIRAFDNYRSTHIHAQQARQMTDGRWHSTKEINQCCHTVYWDGAATQGRTKLQDRDSSLFLSGVLDSFTLVEFVTLLDKECGIRVNDADMRTENFDTIVVN